MRSTKATIVLAAVIVVLIGLGVWMLWPQQPSGVTLPAAAPRAGAAPAMWPAPQFAFPDQDDSSISTQSLRGRVWIADFIFTSCANTCPKMTARRAELQKQITDPRVMFLSFSVDPERDDRSTRKSYAAANGLDESRWRFVQPPDKAAAWKLAQSMKIAAVKHDHGDSPILHSDRFILIDSNARIRGTYALADEAAMQRLVSDALNLASAAGPATGPSKP
jgi:protein SCO1/2